jgi:hypothetical protein
LRRIAVAVVAGVRGEVVFHRQQNKRKIEGIKKAGSSGGSGELNQD